MNEVENQGLLFIPDISGFTRFVTETEIDHSRRIIEELLEVVIDANEIGLEISEIEGDAVLFYRFGDSPDLGQLTGQVERMFRAFHQRLSAYAITRFCQCRACVSAAELTLKVVTHYGEFTSYTVRQFKKLIGKDVIVAHQLLKNDIDHHEYWLVTSGLPGGEEQAVSAPWIRWMPGVKRTEGGEIAFRYTPLGELKQSVPPATLPDLGMRRASRVLSASREYDTHIIALFHATGDPDYRSRWQEGVQRVEHVGHVLPRVGMKSRLVMGNGTATVQASSFSFHPDRIVFSETVEDRSASSVYTLERLAPERTRLTIDRYVRAGWMRELWFRLTRRRESEAALLASLANLEGVVEELRVSAEY